MGGRSASGALLSVNAAGAHPSSPAYLQQQQQGHPPSPTAAHQARLHALAALLLCPAGLAPGSEARAAWLGGGRPRAARAAKNHHAVRVGGGWGWGNGETSES